MKNFETTKFGDYTSEKIQSNMGNFLRQIEGFPFFNGLLLKDIALSATAKAVPHKLDRIPSGYLITKRSTGQTVYSSTINDRTITLTATGAVTVDIWIY